ncbi:AbrB/MazE/SpoVT family DNA-binding domain-containing protein [Rhizobium sp. Root482]|uniref:AbrB/MazE/SpoVT family DNA-binding domain-containing protein n=1 Tax=Rhizobium sp. Root482 TaxID=1736543 RepID=UPI0006F84174|nr:AbrB/MazE/SpoVT family DNA-binding domain-containing protein [Rhizobium sp. Root482]KQY19933.1 AbrB family transcriptional regulator [Rhizobium sp. Root482]
MQVSKWGNSLAIRIPSAVVEALQLKEGDEIAVRIADERAFEIERDRTREEALGRVMASARRLPAGWTFDRGEANAR